jgi:hypothetical protein
MSHLKIGVRKPSIKKSIKNATTSAMKREVRSSVDPLYGEKGWGAVQNPKKAIKNKIYHKTTVNPIDVRESKSVKNTVSNENEAQIKQIEKRNKKDRIAIGLFMGFAKFIIFLLCLPFLLLGLFFLHAQCYSIGAAFLVGEAILVGAIVYSAIKSNNQ